LKRSKSGQFARRPSVRAALAVFLFGILLAGCAGYQLGPTNGVPAGSRSVQVRLFRNDTWEPRLSEPLATSLRRWIQRDGTYRLATRDDADIVVEGVITDFNRSGISFEPSDVLTVRDYELSAVATFSATELATGKVIMNSTVIGRTTIRAGPDLPSAERQAAPLIAEDMARRITSLLVDGSW
ncbi:MAG TPA: LPS assembly lipoprotein LptE, partial [Verrucomicrobiae bacterium]|nr:LPS assembly lipoprotein LptE [Verrucomicrobiae bacterium]